jgi:anti-sigma B factor antagonist
MELKSVLHGEVKELIPRARSVDASNVHDFKEQMRQHLAPSQRLILNLESVDFLDSSGLGSLVWLLRETESREGRVMLCGLQKPVQLLLEVVRMHRVFDIYPDTPRALKGFQDAA